MSAFKLVFQRANLFAFFVNVIPVDHMSKGGHFVYRVVDDHGSDEGTITLHEAGGMDIFVDNFPGEKKYYSTTLPIKSFADFIGDVSRAGLDLVVRAGDFRAIRNELIELGSSMASDLGREQDGRIGFNFRDSDDA